MLRRALICLLGLPWIGSCTTLASGVLSGPPGIHSASFRECLLANGFFTRTALQGIAAEDYKARHKDGTKHSPDRKAILQMSDPDFIALTSRTIHNNFLPHLQIGEDKLALIDPSRSRPYGQNIASGPYPEAGIAEQEIPATGNDSQRPEIAINRYLDCYIGPVGHETPGEAGRPGLLATNDGDADLEGRLLRAHILLSLSASYGAELLASRPAPNLTNYAERLLEHVASAEMAIRLASPVMNRHVRAGLPSGGASLPGLAADGSRVTLFRNPPLTEQVNLRWAENTTRILRVFQVAVDIQVIDGRQSLDRATNILAAFTNPTTAKFGAVLKDALRGFGTIQKVRFYGDAMLRDARETLAAHRNGISGGTDFTYALPKTPEKGSAEYLWRLWDRPLTKACTIIASSARIERGCIPSDQDMESATKNLGPLLPAA